MPTESRIYIIEGKKFTAKLLAKELKCQEESARNRLKKCKTLKELYKPVKGGNGGSFSKEYVFEGTILTANSLAKKLNCSKGTARLRLINSKTIAEVFAPVTKQKVSKEWKSGNAHNRKLTDISTPMNKLAFGKW